MAPLRHAAMAYAAAATTASQIRLMPLLSPTIFRHIFAALPRFFMPLIDTRLLMARYDAIAFVFLPRVFRHAFVTAAAAAFSACHDKALLRATLCFFRRHVAFADFHVAMFHCRRFRASAIEHDAIMMAASVNATSRRLLSSSLSRQVYVTLASSRFFAVMLDIFDSYAAMPPC